MGDKVEGTSNQDPNFRRDQFFSQKKKEEKKDKTPLSFEQDDAYEHSEETQVNKMIYSQDPKLQKNILKKINSPKPGITEADSI